MKTKNCQAVAAAAGYILEVVVVASSQLWLCHDPRRYYRSWYSCTFEAARLVLLRMALSR